MNGKLKTIFVFVLLTATVFSGCLDDSINNDDPEILIVNDIRGRNVTVPAEINRIIALGACSLRIISYFDSIEKVIAVDAQEKTSSAMFGEAYFNSSTYRLAFPELRDLPGIGNPSSVNIEAVLAQNPDIVFSATTDVTILDTLEQQLGLPVVAVNADLEMDDERFFQQILIIGKILGEEERALELNAGLHAIMDDLAGRVENITTEKNAYAAGMFFYGGGGLLKTSGDYLPFNFTGINNVMPSSAAGVGKQPYDTDIETLISKNPEFIFIDSITENVCKTEYNENKEILDNITAFSNQSVYTTLVYKNYGTNWENQVVNMYYVGSIVYPELYDDINITQKAEEIFYLFFQKELNYDVVAELQNGPGLSQAYWWD